MEKQNDQFREYARNYASQGLGLLAHALNAFNESARKYSYSVDDIERFNQLAMEIVSIIEHGVINTNSIHAARCDSKFQLAMSKITAIK